MRTELNSRETDSKLGEGLTTLKEMASAINSELQEQEVIVDDIDRATDKAQTQMDAAIKTMEKLTGSKNSCQLCTIVILVVIFVVGACLTRCQTSVNSFCPTPSPGQPATRKTHPHGPARSCCRGCNIACETISRPIFKLTPQHSPQCAATRQGPTPPPPLRPWRPAPPPRRPCTLPGCQCSQ